MIADPEMTSRELIERLCSAFNRADRAGMLELVAEGVVHEPHKGVRETGRAQLQGFLQTRARCYLEVLTDVRILVSKNGGHAAAEYVVSGQYLSTDHEQPLARGQRYRISGGAFFDIADKRVTRVSHFCNLADWFDQVS